MRSKAVLCMCLVALALSFSFAAIVYAQSSLPPMQNAHGSNRLVFSTTLLLGAGLHGKSGPPNQSTRIEIYNFVKNNPGVHFRGVCRDLGLSVGVVQYHLNFLVGAGLLSVFDDGQYRRYFEFGTFAEGDTNLISLLRHDQPRKILIILSQSGPTLHKDLAYKLGVSSQALTWQMNRLKSLLLVDAVKEGMSIRYSLNRETTSSLSTLLRF